MEERFKEIKIHDRRVETYQEDVLAFIHQERQLAKKEVLGEVLKMRDRVCFYGDEYLEAYTKGHNTAENEWTEKIENYAKENNITLE